MQLPEPQRSLELQSVTTMPCVRRGCLLMFASRLRLSLGKMQAGCVQRARATEREGAHLC